uniref:Uncharacterized protein n=1 Tax=Sinocyclocheilus rhinocerous TaxID=307959 RepID=A0A673K0Z8_9TELE
MSSLFRSEEMRLVQLFFQTEAAHNCINELVHLGLVQFKDVSNLSESWCNSISKAICEGCEEMERILSKKVCILL